MTGVKEGDPMKQFEDQLRRLLDERAIHAVLLRYCRGVDRCDESLVASCYHDDACDDHGNWLGHGAGIAPHILGLVKPGRAAAMHFVGNVSIEVEGDVAFSESYVLALRVSGRNGKKYTRTRAARFVDRFERREGLWKISERVVVDDWNRVDEILEHQEGSEQFRYSSKDDSDPVFAIRRGRVARTSVSEQL